MIFSSLSIKNSRFTKKTTISILILLVLTVAPSHAFFDGEGETGAGFLRVPLGARAAAMGGSFTAIRGGADSIEYNPGALAGTERFSANLSHAEHLEDTSFQELTMAFPFEFGGKINEDKTHAYSVRKFVAGGRIKFFSADDERREAETGISHGDFDIKSQLFQLSLAYTLSKAWSIGGSANVIRESIDDDSYSNKSIDAGVHFAPSDSWQFGASILQLGPDQGFISEKDPLPTSLRIGAAHSWNKFLFATDLVAIRDNTFQKSLGTEFQPLPFLALRAGILHHTTLELSLGMGIMFTKIIQKRNAESDTQISPESKGSQLGEVPNQTKSNRKPFDIGMDYAVQTNNDLGLTHRINIRIVY